MTYVSSDLEDAEPLTPANLLHGHWITSLPHEVVEELDLTDPTYGNRTDVSQRTNLQAFLLNQFQACWKYKYLTSLREYHRATLAIVEELITGRDGLTHAAKIKTSQGRTNHPVAKLIPLEVSTLIALETD